MDKGHPEYHSPESVALGTRQPTVEHCGPEPKSLRAHLQGCKMSSRDQLRIQPGKQRASLDTEQVLNRRLLLSLTEE